MSVCVQLISESFPAWKTVRPKVIEAEEKQKDKESKSGAVWGVRPSIHRQHLAGWQPPDREVASFNAGRQLRICVMRGGGTAGRGPPARAATGPPSPSSPVVHPDPASFANSIIINQHIGPHMPYYASIVIKSKERTFLCLYV